MNAGQYVAINHLFDTLAKAGSEHWVTRRSAPLSTILRCKCGWSTQVHCRNAMGRKSKEHAAIRRHLLQVAEYYHIELKEPTT